MHQNNKGGALCIEERQYMKSLSQISQTEGIKHGTLRQWINRGKIKAVKNGRDWLVSSQEIIKIRKLKLKYETRKKTVGEG